MKSYPCTFSERINQASPSPSSSPASVASVDIDTPRFECPRCGKSFTKVSFQVSSASAIWGDYAALGWMIRGIVISRERDYGEVIRRKSALSIGFWSPAKRENLLTTQFDASCVSIYFLYACTQSQCYGPWVSSWSRYERSSTLIANGKIALSLCFERICSRFFRMLIDFHNQIGKARLFRIYVA